MSKKTNRLLLFLAPFLITILVFLTVSSLVVPKTKQEQLVSPDVAQKVATFSAEIAPSMSQKGTITSLFGDVFWQSRVATDSAKITEFQDIHQGELLKTGDNGTVKVDFPGEVKLNISPKTTVSIIQTLPANFVFNQTNGTTEYIRTGEFPLSIRSLHLLIDSSKGDITITTDSDQKTVSLVVKQGNAQVAFNDTDLVSQEASVSAGKEYDFDDQTRTATLADY